MHVARPSVGVVRSRHSFRAFQGTGRAVGAEAGSARGSVPAEGAERGGLAPCGHGGGEHDLEQRVRGDRRRDLGDCDDVDADHLEEVILDRYLELFAVQSPHIMYFVLHVFIVMLFQGSNYILD